MSTIVILLSQPTVLLCVMFILWEPVQLCVLGLILSIIWTLLHRRSLDHFTALVSLQKQRPYLFSSHSEFHLPLNSSQRKRNNPIPCEIFDAIRYWHGSQEQSMWKARSPAGSLPTLVFLYLIQSCLKHSFSWVSYIITAWLNWLQWKTSWHPSFMNLGQVRVLSEKSAMIRHW